MATIRYWRCLSRPRIPCKVSANGSSSLVRATTTPFSTSTTLFSSPGGKAKVLPPSVLAKALAQKAKGKRNSARIKKSKPPPKTGKPPASGERKAMRKRVVLSNTNALEVQMKDLDEGLLGDMLADKGDVSKDFLRVALLHAPEPVEGSLVGRMVGLKGETVDSLRASEAFKAPQGWSLFRRPALLVREESVLVSRKLIEAQEKKTFLKMLIDGNKGTGKSLMLMHAMATAFVKGWIVLHMPEAQDVVNAGSSYAAIPGTTPTLWAQPTYTADWLTRINKANNKILGKLTLTQTHKLPIPIQPDITLSRLCELGARDPDVAWPFFQALWSEITAPGRPPILLCVDSVNHLMQNSSYLKPDLSTIHAHDLAIVKLIVDHLTSGETLTDGRRKLPNGGAILAASSRSHAPTNISLNLALQNAVEKQNGSEITPRDPWEKKYDSRADKALNDFEPLILKGLSKVEARGLMEYWAQSGVLRARVDEKEVSEKWTLAGNGIIGEIQRGALRMRI